MTISGFTYVRNGFKFGYPFVPSILSIIDIVDEFIVVVGDSTDGTREALEGLNHPKIKIIDTIWDENKRTDGSVFAEQSNIGIKHIKGDWGLHLQVDEVIHEADLPKILTYINKADEILEADGLLFPFLHFWGDYEHIRNTRKTHKYEIRAFKNTGFVRSYKDSQGFRIYSSEDSFQSGEKGTKLKVLKTEVPIFHYSYSRHPKLMKNKANYFHKFWHNEEWIKEHTDERPFDYNEVDKLEAFTGTHPKYMHDIIAHKDWDFKYNPSKSTMSIKDKIMYYLEKMTGKRLFTYRNYDIIKG